MSKTWQHNFEQLPVRCSVSVGEPWDFEGPDGQNIIHGSIVKFLNDRCALFKADHMQHFRAVSGDTLLLLVRHYGYDFSELRPGVSYISVNGCMLMDEREEETDVDALIAGSTFVLIGGVDIT